MRGRGWWGPIHFRAHFWKPIDDRGRCLGQQGDPGSLACPLDLARRTALASIVDAPAMTFEEKN